MAFQKQPWFPELLEDLAGLVLFPFELSETCEAAGIPEDAGRMD